LGCGIIEVTTELPISFVLRLLAAALGLSNFWEEPAGGVLVVFTTFAFCALPPLCTDFFPALGGSSESELPPDAELESSDDVESPELELPSVSSEGLMVGRVWLELAGEHKLGINEAVVPSTSIAAAFGVGASSSDFASESLPSSDEDSDESPGFNLFGVEAVVCLVDFGFKPDVIFFTSSLRDLSDSEFESELDSSSDSESGLFRGEGVTFVLMPFRDRESASKSVSVPELSSELDSESSEELNLASKSELFE